MWDYTDKVKEYFLEPKNAGALEDANAIGEVGSLACGDALKLYLKISDEGVIVDASFQTFGCASAIASSSALTELLKGKTVAEVEHLTNKDIAEFLGGLPKEKMHCSVMGEEALQAALANYRGEKAPEKENEGEIVCHCFGVTDVTIRRAIMENDIKTVEDITNFTKAGGGCGECQGRLAEILQEVRGDMAACTMPASDEPKALSNVERMQRVLMVIEEEIRPSLKQDGGDIKLVDIVGSVVKVSLRGACSNCPARKLTLSDFVERTLRDQVDSEITVEEVSA